MSNWRYTVILSRDQYTIAYTPAELRRMRWNDLTAVASDIRKEQKPHEHPEETR